MEVVKGFSSIADSKVAVLRMADEATFSLDYSTQVSACNSFK